MPEVNTTINAKANQSTTYTKSEVDTSVSTKAKQIKVATALRTTDNVAEVYTKGKVYGRIPDMLEGIMQLYSDETGTGRGAISHIT